MCVWVRASNGMAAKRRAAATGGRTDDEEEAARDASYTDERACV